MNAGIIFSKRDLHVENVRDTARRVREANRRTTGAIAGVAADLGRLFAEPVALEDRDLRLADD